MKKSRCFGFVIILLGYFLAALAGILVFNALSLDTVYRVLCADIAGTLVIYALSLIFNNASFYDPYWSVQPPVILILLASRFGFSMGTLLLLAAVSYWALRLTANWAYTFCNLDTQDWRYTMLHQKSGKLFFLVNLFGIQLFPTFIVFLCILPAIRFIEYGGGFNGLTAVGLAVCVLAATLQLVSDIQVHRFRAMKTGGIIRSGLWANSRHPNYLGEILMWWGVYIAAVSVFPSLWHLFIGALCNTLMFLFISIPMAEKRLAGYKPGFDEYCQATRMLLPIPRKARPSLKV